MLHLLLELGQEFGKSMILSTHLLADVETICEQVVILLNGQVRGEGTVAELCSRRRDRYRLQLQGDPVEFARGLAKQGVQILAENSRGEMQVYVPANWNMRDFFVLAETHNVLLRGIQSDDESLEELFLRTVNHGKQG
jgi:ABC-2 type transport system ATP-binding protein